MGEVTYSLFRKRKQTIEEAKGNITQNTLNSHLFKSSRGMVANTSKYNLAERLDEKFNKSSFVIENNIFCQNLNKNIKATLYLAQAHSIYYTGLERLHQFARCMCCTLIYLHIH